MTTTSELAVTVLISRQVKQGCEVEFERLMGDLLAPWPQLPRLMLLPVLVVCLMTWVVGPLLSRLLKPWLYGAERTAASD